MNLNWTYLFPLISIALNLGASAVYALHSDWNRTVYWFAAATLTTCITLR